MGDILSVTTGRLVSSRHMEGIYDILDFMTGENLFTHQLPRASRECKPHLLKQHPQLAEVDASGVNQDNWEEWLTKQVNKYGEQLPVTPLPEGMYEVKDPIQEVQEMMPRGEVIVVNVDD